MSINGISKWITAYCTYCRKRTTYAAGRCIDDKTKWACIICEQKGVMAGSHPWVPGHFHIRSYRPAQRFRYYSKEYTSESAIIRRFMRKPISSTSGIDYCNKQPSDASLNFVLTDYKEPIGEIHYNYDDLNPFPYEEIQSLSAAPPITSSKKNSDAKIKVITIGKRITRKRNMQIDSRPKSPTDVITIGKRITRKRNMQIDSRPKSPTDVITIGKRISRKRNMQIDSQTKSPTDVITIGKRIAKKRNMQIDSRTKSPTDDFVFSEENYINIYGEPIEVYHGSSEDSGVEIVD